MFLGWEKDQGSRVELVSKTNLFAGPNGRKCFFFQNHARTEDFSWEFSDCKRCKFLCRKMRISWKIDEGLDLWMCFFLGGGRGRKYHLSRNFGRRFTLVVPSDIFFGATPGCRLASSINMLDTFNIEYQQYAWTRLDKLTGCQWKGCVLVYLFPSQMTHDLVLEAAPLTLHCEVRTVWFAVLAENFNAPWNEEICRGPGDGASLKRYIFLNRGDI